MTKEQNITQDELSIILSRLMKKKIIAEIKFLGNINYIRFVYKSGKMGKFSFTDGEGYHQGEINTFVESMHTKLKDRKNLVFDDCVMIFSKDPFTHNWIMSVIKH